MARSSGTGSFEFQSRKMLDVTTLACVFQCTNRGSQPWDTSQEESNRVPFYHLGYSIYIQTHIHTPHPYISNISHLFYNLFSSPEQHIVSMLAFLQQHF